MKKIAKNIKQTPETVKFSLEVGKRQDKFEIIKGVKKVPMSLSMSPKQFRELFFQKSSNKALKSQRANCRPSFSEN